MTNITSKHNWTFNFLSMAYWFSLYSYGSTLAIHSYSMGISETFVGIIVGSYGLAQLLFRIPVGVISDRINRRKIFIGLGLVLSAISCFGLGSVNTANGLLFFRFLAGIAVSSFVVFPSYLSNILKNKDMHKVTTILSATGKLGRMIALLAGSLLAQLINTSWSFYLGGIIAVIGIVLWIKLPSDHIKKDKNNLSIKQLVLVIKDRNLVISALLTSLFQFSVFATIYSFVPIYAKSLSMNDFSIGLLTSMFTFSGVISAILSGKIFKRVFGARNTIIGGFMISGLLFFMIPYVNSVILLYIVQFMCGFFMGLLLPMLMAQALKTVDKNKSSSAMGFFQAIYSLGTFFGPFVVGAIIENGSIKSGFLLVSVICIIAGILTYIYKRSDIKNERLA